MDTKDTYDPDKYEKPGVTVDVLFFTIKDGKLQVLLIKRAAWPFEGYWALPGGFVNMKEDLDAAAAREVYEECGIKNLFLEQLFTFGDPNRDPRTRVITVAYYALAPSEDIKKVQVDEVKEAKYFPIEDLPKMAFDHKKIIEVGFERLKNKIGYSSIVFGLLPKEFSLSDVQGIYETIYGKSIDKRNFRKWMISTGLLVSTGKKKSGLAHRPALLYKFAKREVVNVD